jgi:membrane-associated phospholipid phosphatase
MFAEKQIKAAASALMDLDDRAHRAVGPYAEKPAMAPVHQLGKLGDQPELRTLAGAIIAGGIVAGSDRLVRAGARLIIAHEAATAAKDVVKNRVDRTRPRSAKGRGDKKLRKGRPSSKEESSFPSGHSAGAMAVARAFSREYPEYAGFALGAAGLVAASQVPRNAHYPTDIVAGAAIGLLAEAVTDAVWRAAGMDDLSKPERLEQQGADQRSA